MESKVPLKEIPELVGYADLAYFYRVFKKYFGMTPGTMHENLK
jgi:two-component system, response regulator YesN